MKNITVYRDDHSQHSTTISNHVINDKNLSYQARFLLVWLLSTAADEDFKISIDEIPGLTGIPMSRTRLLVQELENSGHIKLLRNREGNRYGYYHWYVFEQPEDIEL